MNRIFRILRLKKVWIPLVALIIVGAGAAFAFSGEAPSEIVTVTAERGTVREEVSVVGRLQPTERLELGLLSGGRVAYIGAEEGERVRRGQTIVSLSSDDLQAQLASAVAGLDRERIRLNQLGGGAREEDVAVTEANVAAARTTRNNAEIALGVQLGESFTSVDSTMGANIDQLYDRPRTSSPEFGVTIGSGSTRYFINAPSQTKDRLSRQQAQAINLLREWNEELSNDRDDLEGGARAGLAATAYLQTYLADLASVINAYRPDSSTEQAIYDGFKADVASARSTVSAAASAISSAQSSFASAEAALTVSERQLDLKTGASASSDIELQQAAIRGAQAQVDLARAQIAKNAVVSPVDGIVTVLTAKVGENVSAANPVVTVMADAKLEIEARVPEADIAKIRVENEARVTLDAYSGEDFTARVIYVAPAEEIIDGVATYKVKLQLSEEDARLKPGMSADLDISTNVRENVITLPQRAIITRDGVKTVRVQEGTEIKDVVVQTGIRGVDGRIEITGGLQGGETVVTSAPSE